jgi:hypothetical protein
MTANVPDACPTSGSEELEMCDADEQGASAMTVQRCPGSLRAMGGAGGLPAVPVKGALAICPECARRIGVHHGRRGVLYPHSPQPRDFDNQFFELCICVYADYPEYNHPRDEDVWSLYTVASGDDDWEMGLLGDYLTYDQAVTLADALGYARRGFIGGPS